MISTGLTSRQIGATTASHQSAPPHHMPPGTYWLSVGAWLRRQRPLLPPLASHSLRCDGGSWVVDSHPFCLCWWTKWTPLPTSVCPTPIYILMRRLLPLLQRLGVVGWYYVNFYTQIVYFFTSVWGWIWENTTSYGTDQRQPDITQQSNGVGVRFLCVDYGREAFIWGIMPDFYYFGASKMGWLFHLFWNWWHPIECLGGYNN